MASQPSIVAKSAVLEPHHTKAESVLLSLETTSRSIPHRVARYLSGGRAGQSSVGIRFYLTLISLTYIPVFLSALASSLPLAKQSQSLRLPFLYDVNNAFAFLISFPVLVAVMLTDQRVLTSALRQVQREKVLIVSQDSAQALKIRWEWRFRAINIAAQVIGVLTGITVAWYLHSLFTVRGGLGTWAESHGKLVPAGYVYLLCIAFDYAFIPLYIIRCVAFAFFLKDLVAKAEIHLLPFHPDHCGGLRPVGRLGMRNQYVLTFFGINVVLNTLFTFHYFWLPGARILSLFAAVAYLLFGPLVFIGPLLPFRAGMLQTKNLLMGEVAQRLRVELDRLRQKMPAEKIAKEDEELIDRLRRIGAIIDELPVWPFDAGTLRKFLTAYIIPILSAVAVSMGKTIFDWLIPKISH